MTALVPLVTDPLFPVVALVLGCFSAVLYLVGKAHGIADASPEPEVRYVEVPVEVVPPVLERLAKHLDWDPEDGSSIARRIHDRWNELELEAMSERRWADDYAQEARGLRFELEATRDQLRDAEECADLRVKAANEVARAWEARCKEHEAQQPYASHLFGGSVNLDSTWLEWVDGAYRIARG